MTESDVEQSQTQKTPRPDLTLWDIMTELKGMRGELSKDINEVKQDVDNNKTEIQQLKDRQEHLERENKQLTDQITHLQDYNRRNNLIVGGIAEQEGRETKDETEAKVKHHLVADLHIEQQVVDQLSIDKAQRLGQKKNNQTCRVIKVQFSNLKDKERVLKQARARKLEKPYFREDFSAEILDSRSKLRPGLLKAREGDLQTFLAFDKLIVQKDEKKNVYTYDRQTKSIKIITHVFDDKIEWPRENR